MDMAEKDETEGRCPACRAPYDKEKIGGMEAKCERVVAKKDREIKSQKPKPKKPEEKKDLSNVRVIQRKMAYVIGLPLSLADEEILQQKNYFGQYGKVTKVSLSRTAGGAIQQFVNDSCSVYITYSKEEEAVRCIQSVHGFLLEGRALRASFGTAKYCHAWLKNTVCNNSAFLYLHTFGADEDRFGKDEEAAVHTRNRVHQIVGATHNMQWRSGTTLPPPLDEPFDSNVTATDKINPNNWKIVTDTRGRKKCVHSKVFRDPASFRAIENEPVELVLTKHGDRQVLSIKIMVIIYSNYTGGLHLPIDKAKVTRFRGSRTLGDAYIQWEKQAA